MPWATTRARSTTSWPDWRGCSRRCGRVLDGDAATALSRATQREGPVWLDWYVAKLAGYRVSPPVTDIASAVEYLARERAVTLAAARDGWGLVMVDGADGLSPDEVLRAVRQALRP